MWINLGIWQSQLPWNEMAKQFDALEPQHQSFIEAQHLFFVATAGPEGRVNVSPKGMDSLRVVAPNRLLWLNYTGSGNETAGHLLQSNRITLMWCSFEKRPQILRVYGSAKTIHKGDSGWADRASHFNPDVGARQIFDVDFDLVQTSCGYAVPFMEFVSDRDLLSDVNRDKGEDGLRDYRNEKNRHTIDGMPTGLPQDLS